MTHSDSSTTSASRTVRVFISSTFRDFVEERDLLVRKVFPELRRRARERFVEVVEVDLRWGITSEQAERGEVLPICLSEIDRCRPYFLGLLGERHGWVPAASQFDAELVARMPWLGNHRGAASVTELEILHGVLNNPAMAGRALFHFRDPAWARERGGDHLPASPEEGARIHALKERIRRSGFPVHEGYTTPEDFALRAQEQLWNLIDEEYPARSIPTGEERLTLAHADFARSRLVAFVPRPTIRRAIDEHFVAVGSPLVLRGAAGTGKSALLADWWQHVVADALATERVLVFYHAIGGAPDSADPEAIQRRLLQWFVQHGLAEADSLTDERRYTLAVSMALVAAEQAGRSIVLVLDALDQLTRRSLHWLPVAVPANTRLLLSTQPGILDGEIAARGWTAIDVPLLTRAETEALVHSYLARFRKGLSNTDSGVVLGAPGVQNPLFLRVLLDELRQVGRHGELAAQVRHYAAGGTIEDLFDRILARIEGDFGRGLVGRLLALLACARSGLSEPELQRILSRPGDDGMLPRAVLAPLLGALDEHLTRKTGYLSVFHGALTAAIARRHLAQGRAEFHQALACMFAELESTAPRRLFEELHHWLGVLADRRDDPGAAAHVVALLNDTGRAWDKIALGGLEDLVRDHEEAAGFLPDDLGDSWRFLKHRITWLRSPKRTKEQCRLYLQMALEDGEDSAVTCGARAWIEGPRVRAPAVAWAAPALARLPDPYEALHAHPLYPGPRDLVGHEAWITGWWMLTCGDVVTWSRDSFLLTWSLACERPIRRIEGFGSGTLGAIELGTGRIVCWGFDGALRVVDVLTGQASDVGAGGATIEAAMRDEIGALLLRDVDGCTWSWAVDAATPVRVDGGVWDGAEDLPGRLHPSVENDDGSGVGVGCEGLDRPEDLLVSWRATQRAVVRAADSLCVDHVTGGSVQLTTSAGTVVPWHARSSCRVLWSHPPSDLHVVATLTMVVAVRTRDFAGGNA